MKPLITEALMKEHIKMSTDNTLYGVLPPYFREAAKNLVNEREIIDGLKADLTDLLSDSASYGYVLGVSSRGFEVFIANTGVGLRIYEEDIKQSVIKSPITSWADSAALLVAASAIERAVEKVMAKYPGELENKSSTVYIGSKGANITGVSLLSASGAGSCVLTYTAATDMLAITGGTSAKLYLDGDYTIAKDGVAYTFRVAVSSLPVGDATDNVFYAESTGSIEQPTNVTGVTLNNPVGALGDYALAFAQSSTVTQPTNVTGVTLSLPSDDPGTYTLSYTAETIGTLTNVTGVVLSGVKGADASYDLNFTYNGGTGMTLDWAGGTPVVVDAGGDFELAGSTATNIITATVTTGSLPAADQTDASVAVTTPKLAFDSGAAVDLSGADATVALTGSSADVSAAFVRASLPAADQSDADIEIALGSGATLSWDGGTAVDVSAGGLFTISDGSGNSVDAFVDTGTMPSSDQTDAAITVSESKAAAAIAYPLAPDAIVISIGN